MNATRLENNFTAHNSQNIYNQLNKLFHYVSMLNRVIDHSYKNYMTCGGTRLIKRCLFNPNPDQSQILVFGKRGRVLCSIPLTQGGGRCFLRTGGKSITYVYFFFLKPLVTRSQHVALISRNSKYILYVKPKMLCIIQRDVTKSRIVYVVPSTCQGNDDVRLSEFSSKMILTTKIEFFIYFKFGNRTPIRDWLKC